MNPTPRLNWKGFVGEIDNPGCGRLAMKNVERAFWQSRMTRVGAPADLPDLIDIPAFAAAARATPANAENL